MATVKFLTIAIFSAAVVNGASLLSEQARNLANPGPLLKRCPCVPINTCYAQGVSLNEQDFLNTHFECPDYTQNHCCGPYFPTLGSDDFYFDDAQRKFIPGFSNTGEAVAIVMAQNVTTAEPRATTSSRVMTVLPETTTAEYVTTTEVEDSSTTTAVEAETTTEADEVTEDPTTTTEIVTTTTTTVKPKPRLPKTHSRRVLPRFERKSTTTTVEPPSTTTTASSSTTKSLRRTHPTRRTSLYRSEFRQRLIGSRVRSSTTTVATVE